MFKELQPLLAQRALTITVVAVGQQQIRVNVIPHSRPEDLQANAQIKYNHKDEVASIPESAVKALTAPVSLTGTAEEIDDQLSAALVAFAQSHAKLQTSVDNASVQIAEAVKAIDDRNKARAKSKSSSAKAEQKQDQKAEPAKSAKDESLPLWWTDSSVAAQGTTAAPANAEAKVASEPSSLEGDQSCR